MDKSLDDVIAARPRPNRRGAGRGTGRRTSAKDQVLGHHAHAARAAAQNVAAAKVVAAAAPASQPTDKIIVSNLPVDVNEIQIKELFHSTVGPLREVTLHYDSAGRSKGVAAVHFQRKGDGTKAYQQYNNRLIDGKRPMKIEIVVDPARPAPPQSLASRVAPPPAAAAAAAATAAGVVPHARAARPAVRGARRGRGRGRKTNERPQKSVADLDAEMEDYTASNVTAPAAAAV
jgi:THO complex subunit 4